MVIDSLNSTVEFFRNNIGVFVALLLPFIGSIVWTLRFIINRNNRLNIIYVIHGIKSSSLKPQYLLGGRPVPAYYKLDEYQSLKETLKRGEHVLVIGAPLSGKTRAIFQALKSIAPAANIYVPRLLNIEPDKFKVPFNLIFWRKKILVLDDIDKFTEKQNIKYLVDEFLKKKAVIVASCRTGTEYEKLQGTEWLNIFFKKEDIVVFPEDIPDKKGEEIASIICVEWNPSEFDGKIGSLVMPLDIMRARFLTKLSRASGKTHIMSLKPQITPLNSFCP